MTVDALGDAHYASTCTAPNAYSCYKTKDLKNPKSTVVPTTITDAYVFTVDAPHSSGDGVCPGRHRLRRRRRRAPASAATRSTQPALPKPHPRVATKDGIFTGSQLELLKSQLICEPCGADPVPLKTLRRAWAEQGGTALAIP